jgi:hypothetical protein
MTKYRNGTIALQLCGSANAPPQLKLKEEDIMDLITKRIKDRGT